MCCVQVPHVAILKHNQALAINQEVITVEGFGFAQYFAEVEILFHLQDIHFIRKTAAMTFEESSRCNVNLLLALHYDEHVLI